MRTVNYRTQFRIIGSAIALLLQSGNSLAMFLAMRGDILKDPDIATLQATQFKYITVWNVAFQITYAIISLLCDVPLLIKMKEDSWSTYCIKYLRSYRKIFFGGVIFPAGLTIFTIFWPFYLFDRELVFPAFIDKALSQVSNHIMHTAILPIVLWELVFYPRSKPSSHRLYLYHMAAIFVSYLIVLFTDYAHRGTWPYPFFTYIYGTIYFPLVMALFAILYTTMYFMQWPLTSLIFPTSVKTEKVK